MPRRSDRTAQRKEALRLYATGMTIIEVARIVHVSEPTCALWMREAGVTRKPGQTIAARQMMRIRTAALLELATTGDSVSAVAKRRGIPRSTLATWQAAEEDVIYRGEWVRDGLIVRGSSRDIA